MTHKLTILLTLKTKDNLLAYVKVIEDVKGIGGDVKNYAVCLIPQNDSEWEAFAIGVNVDIVKNATNGDKNARLDGVWSFHIFFTKLMLGEKIKTFKIPIKYLPIAARNSTRVEKYYDCIADWDQFVNDMGEWMGVNDTEAQTNVLIRYLSCCKTYNIYNLQNIKIRRPYIDESQRFILIEVIQM